MQFWYTVLPFTQYVSVSLLVHTILFNTLVSIHNKLCFGPSTCTCFNIPLVTLKFTTCLYCYRLLTFNLLLISHQIIHLWPHQMIPHDAPLNNKIMQLVTITLLTQQCNNNTVQHLVYNIIWYNFNPDPWSCTRVTDRHFHTITQCPFKAYL